MMYQLAVQDFPSFLNLSAMTEQQKIQDVVDELLSRIKSPETEPASQVSNMIYICPSLLAC